MSYYDPIDVFLSDTHHKARKEHKCNECRRKIDKGETYRKECYIFEGKFFTHKTCNHCSVVRKFFLSHHGEFGYGCLYEDLENNYHDWKDKFYADGIRRKWTKRDGTLWKIPKFL